MDVIISSSMHGFPLGRTRRARGDVLRAPSADHGIHCFVLVLFQQLGWQTRCTPPAGTRTSTPGTSPSSTTSASRSPPSTSTASVRAGSGGRRMHYPKTLIRRVPVTLPCAFYQAHGKEMICRASARKHTANTKHTANGALRRVPSPSSRRM